MTVIKDFNRYVVTIKEQNKRYKSILALLSEYKDYNFKIIKNRNKITIIMYVSDDIASEIKQKLAEILDENIKELDTSNTGLSKMKLHPAEGIKEYDLTKNDIQYNRNTRLPAVSIYKGKTPADVLNENGMYGLKECFRLKKTLSKEKYKFTLKAIECACKEWAEKGIIQNEICEISIEDIKKFILDSEDIMNEFLSRVLEQSGYPSVDYFLQYADDDTLRGTYGSIYTYILKMIAM